MDNFNLNRNKIDDRTVFSTNDNETKNILKLASKDIVNKYRISTASRDSIIIDIISILTESDFDNYHLTPIDYLIIRSDIKNFFPSINKQKLYRKINDSPWLSHDTLEVIKKIVFNKRYEGLPQGLSISSPLSEFYLQQTDTSISDYYEADYYNRYVDDIIVFTTNTKLLSNFHFSRKKRTNLDHISAPQSLKLEISNLDLKVKLTLSKLVKREDLEINDTKTNITFSDDTLYFSYLGYHFSSVKKGRNAEFLVIDISDSKIKKNIKENRKYFSIFNNSLKQEVDFWILYYQLLNSFYSITSLSDNDQNKIIHFGLAYNYKHINTDKGLHTIWSDAHDKINNLEISSHKKRKLNQLIGYEDGNVNKALNKSFNYIKLSSNQKNILSSRLEIPRNNTNVKSIMNKIYKTK